MLLKSYIIFYQQHVVVVVVDDRYYLKNNLCTDALVPNDLKDEISRECQLQFLQLNCAEVAAQLSLRDFQLFRDIKPVEYVNDLFQLKSKFGAPNLTRFAQVCKGVFFPTCFFLHLFVFILLFLSE